MITNIDMLKALHRCGAGATVQNVRDELPELINSGIISTRICRLRDRGFCISELLDGRNLWTLTNKGLAELSTAPESEPEPPPAPEPELPEPEFPSQLEYDPDSEPTPDPIAANLLQAMELDAALDDVLRRLRYAPIPARAERVYRKLLSVLPPIMRDALAPITALMDSAT